MIYIGWISTFFLAICAIPQAIDSYKNKHSNGFNKKMITYWFIGDVAGLIYSIYIKDIIYITNFGMNSIFCAMIFYYRFWGKNRA